MPFQCVMRSFFVTTFLSHTLWWNLVLVHHRVGSESVILFSCSFYTYPAKKVSHLYTNEKDGSIQLRNTSLSPPVFDLGTVADSPSSFCCIPSAPPYFFETVVYISSQRIADMGAVSMETHFRWRRYLWCVVVSASQTACLWETLKAAVYCEHAY